MKRFLNQYQDVFKLILEVHYQDGISFCVCFRHYVQILIAKLIKEDIL